MALSNQLFLLVDHIKLLLLERRRSISLNASTDLQDENISLFLESLQKGIKEIEEEQHAQSVHRIKKNLQTQYEDLMTQFRSENSVTTSSGPSVLSDPTIISEDTKHTQVKLPIGVKTPLNDTSTNKNALKATKHSQSLAVPENDFIPYRDDPIAEDQPYLDNQQMYSYYSQALARQDEALDRLGDSIGRQYELSIQIGGELNEHVEILDSVDHHIDRHQTRLRQVMDRLETVTRSSRNNMRLRIIPILIIILMLLLFVLKY